jgi:hypothetical protein
VVVRVYVNAVVSSQDFLESPCDQIEIALVPEMIQEVEFASDDPESAQQRFGNTEEGFVLRAFYIDLKKQVPG